MNNREREILASFLSGFDDWVRADALIEELKDSKLSAQYILYREHDGKLEEMEEKINVRSEELWRQEHPGRGRLDPFVTKSYHQGNYWSKAVDSLTNELGEEELDILKIIMTGGIKI